MNVKTCPECGALITPQLSRCRQCGTYLHGTRLEGWLMKILPEPLASSPGTAIFAVLIVINYLATAIRALPSSPLAFSGYTLQQAGATHGPSIMLGEWWRFVTANFVHHDVVHLAFNLWALVVVGPLVEKLFDRKKMLLLTLVGGVASMIVSHFWYLEVKGGSGMLVVSGGASGAISGLIGAAWVGALRYSPPQPHIAAGMRRWAFILVVFGLVVPGVNNAAHVGGFLFGAGLAWVLPAGLTQSVGAQRMLSVLTGLAFAGVFAAFGVHYAATWSLPGSLERDAQPSYVLGFKVRSGAGWNDSTQVDADRRCTRALEAHAPPEQARDACAFAIRVNPQHTPSYEYLAEIERSLGNDARADRLRAVAARIRSEL